jgi:cation transport regulator ChaC
MLQRFFCSHDRSPIDPIALDDALGRYLHMDEEHRHLLLQEILKHRRFRIFAYGSLIYDPAIPPDRQEKARLQGWETGPFCKDRHLRGLPTRLGITMGALPSANPADQIHGVVLEINLDAQTPDATAGVIDAIRRFARRETTLNPIYRYDMVKVVTASGNPVHALICRADEATPLFLGRTTPLRSAPRRMTLFEKAAIVSTARGTPKSSPRETGLDYFRYILHSRYAAGVRPEPWLRNLVEGTNALRRMLPARARAKLARLEQPNRLLAHKTMLDRRVFRCDPHYAALDPRRIAALRERLRRKMGWREPLPPEQLARTRRLFSHLATSQP